MKRPTLRWPLVSREWADTLAERVERREAERDEADRRYADLNEEYIAVLIVNERLTEDLTETRAKLAASMDAESALAAQIHELAQPVEPTESEMDSVARLVRERDSEKRRADHLQKQWDDALGLDHPAVAAGETWQDRREKKMRYDA